MYLKRVKLGYVQKNGRKKWQGIENISTVWCFKRNWASQSLANGTLICEDVVPSLWKEDCLKSIHAKTTLHEMLARFSKYFSELVCCCCCCWYYCKETVNTQFSFLHVFFKHFAIYHKTGSFHCSENFVACARFRMVQKLLTSSFTYKGD